MGQNGKGIDCSAFNDPNKTVYDMLEDPKDVQIMRASAIGLLKVDPDTESREFIRRFFCITDDDLRG